MAGCAALALTACVAGPVEPSPLPITPSPTGNAPIGNAAAPTPTWSPDLLVAREFPDENGQPVACSIRMRVVTASDTPTEQARMEQIRAAMYLATQDWSTTEVDLADYPADVLAARVDRGTPEATLQVMLLDDYITDDLSASALMTERLILEGFTSCDSD